MASSENTDTERCILTACKTKNSKDLLAPRAQSSNSPSSKGASVVHPTSKISHCALSKRPILLEKGGKDFFWRPSLACCGAVEMGSTLGYVAPLEDALRWLFCGCSTRGMDSSSRIPVANSWSSVRSEPRLKHFRKTRVAGMTF